MSLPLTYLTHTVVGGTRELETFRAMADLRLGQAQVTLCLWKRYRRFVPQEGHRQNYGNRGVLV